MSKLLWIVLLAALSLPALGQTKGDRNLVATRKRGNTTTVLPPRANHQSGPKQASSQLDKLERQTANTVVQPAAKSPKTPAYKLPADKQPATGNGYQQTMPVHATVKNGTGRTSANRSSRGNRSNLYGR